MTRCWRRAPGRLAICAGVMIATCSATAYAREEIAKLTPSDPEAVRGFGGAVAMSTDYIVVGAPSGAGSTIPGAIVVFKREGSEWVQEAEFFSYADHLHADAFGSAVAIDGDVIVAGAPYSGPLGGGVGFASVFRRDGSTWVWETDLESSGSEFADSFGCSVSMDGGRIVVGAKAEGVGSGAAYVFRCEDTTWLEEARLVPGDLADGDTFGRSVSMDGDLVVVGSRRGDDAGATSGSAYVFRRGKGGWAEEAKLTASDAAEGDAFGVSVSLHGEFVVIGAPNKDNVGTNSGAAYVFRWNGASWVEEQKLTASDTAFLDQFGLSVAIETDGILVVTSAYDGAGTSSGSAYLFKRYETEWFELDKLAASDAHANQLFGVSAAVDGQRSVIGAGAAAYVFSVDGDIPTVSTWGILVLALLLFSAGTIALRSRRRSEDRVAMNARCA